MRELVMRMERLATLYDARVGGATVMTEAEFRSLVLTGLGQLAAAIRDLAKEKLNG